MKRRRRRGRLAAAICTVGVLFQGAQCSLTAEDVATLFVQNVASIFITDFVNNQFGVSSGFQTF